MKKYKEFTIRKAEKNDAQSIIDFYNIVAGETEFLSFSKGEYMVSLSEEEQSIESTNTSKNSIMLVATKDEEIAGIATISSTYKAKGKHVGVLGIVVKEECWGIGLGTSMINDLIEWCKGNNITKKISLVTSENNYSAIELYKKLGFVEEGVFKKEIYIDGKYYDLISMGLFI